MSIRSFVGVALLCATHFVDAQQPVSAPEPSSAPRGSLCLFTGAPPSDYRYVVIKRLKFGKGSYGSVNDVLPRLVEEAHALGADAVIEYNGSQRFGFWPWRFVRPVVRGTAIKWSPSRSVDCTSIGGVPTDGTLTAAPAR